MLDLAGWISLCFLWLWCRFFDGSDSTATISMYRLRIMIFGSLLRAWWWCDGGRHPPWLRVERGVVCVVI